MIYVLAIVEEELCGMMKDKLVINHVLVLTGANELLVCLAPR